VAHKAKKALLHGVSVDIHAVVEEDPIVAAIHRHAQVFDPRVEFNFGALQVFSAICVIFAHGANDVGYMTGPLATIYQVYEKGYLSPKVTPAIWVIVLSAGGLVIGLATYGEGLGWVEGLCGLHGQHVLQGYTCHHQRVHGLCTQ
jgi:sodium-dependent phosphate transporter